MARAVRAITEWLILRPKFSSFERKLAVVTHKLKISKAASGDRTHSRGTCYAHPFGYRSVKGSFLILRPGTVRVYAIKPQLCVLSG